MGRKVGDFKGKNILFTKTALNPEVVTFIPSKYVVEDLEEFIGVPDAAGNLNGVLQGSNLLKSPPFEQSA